MNVHSTLLFENIWKFYLEPMSFLVLIQVKIDVYIEKYHDDVEINDNFHLNHYIISSFIGYRSLLKYILLATKNNYCKYHTQLQWIAHNWGSFR